ncbi:hypothetical protein J6590_006868 [Homalodisca vitripennis]|nr:hypothetical protein J6590_006868 [Homalodisca vitripennis]
MCDCQSWSRMLQVAVMWRACAECRGSRADPLSQSDADTDMGQEELPRVSARNHLLVHQGYITTTSFLPTLRLRETSMSSTPSIPLHKLFIKVQKHKPSTASQSNRANQLSQLNSFITPGTHLITWASRLIQVPFTPPGNK